MACDRYYLLASLPHLGDLGDMPPLTTSELLDRVAESYGGGELIEALLLSDDLTQREALLAGETDEISPVVLSEAQIQGEAPLPNYLVSQESQAPFRVAADAVWAAYFTHAADVAKRRGSEFLAAWIGYEAALRNALVEARARTLKLDAEQYLVAAELSDRDADLTSMLSEWSAASDPLAGMRAVDRARWNWLTEHDGWFSFGDDELAAYAAMLMLLERWHRLEKAEIADEWVGQVTQPREISERTAP